MVARRTAKASRNTLAYARNASASGLPGVNELPRRLSSVRSIDGPAESFSLQPAERFTLKFPGTAGQSVAARYPTELFRCVTLQRPDDSVVRRDCGANPSFQIRDTKLDVTGTWKVVYQVRDEFPHAANLQVVSVPDPTVLEVDGPMRPILWGSPGETAYVEFAATAGQKLVIMVSAAGYICFRLITCACPGPVNNAPCPTDVELVDPDGVVAPGDTVTTTRDLEPAPLYVRRTITKTGLWRVRSTGLMGGGIGIQVVEVPDLTAFVALNTEFHATALKPAQRVVLSFPVVAGRHYGLLDVAPPDVFGAEPDVEFLQPDGASARSTRTPPLARWSAPARTSEKSVESPPCSWR